jgi:parallel beta-helix repeat protein
MKKIIGLSLLLLVIAAYISFATDVSGIISTDTVWGIAGSPYVVKNSVTVSNGVTLTVEPGVRVEFAGNYYLAVNGILNATGGEILTDHIVFTHGGGYSGYWTFIQFNAGATGVLNYCDISYGGASTGSIYLNNTLSGVNITNCKISNSMTSGISLANVANPNITNCLFNSNVKGINWAVSSLGTINNCTFTGNSDYPLDIPVAMVAHLGELTISGNTNGDSIYIRGGSITETGGHWQNFNVPYIIGGTVSINAGVENTIDPGTKLKFNNSTNHFYVYGKLLAQGTPTQHIVFTSSKSTPAAGDWGMLYFVQQTVTPEGILDYCDISYGGSSTASLNINNTLDKVNVANCTISNSKTRGINIYNNSNPTITNCLVNNSGTIGIDAGNGQPSIINCIISNSGMAGTASDGIYVWSGGKPNIINSTISNSKYGINWVNSNVGSITNCNITSCDRGISITAGVALKPRRCIIAGNDTGVYVSMTSTTSKPDFGLSSDPGYNVIKNNSAFNFYNASTPRNNRIYAIGNDWGVYDSIGIEAAKYDSLDNATPSYVAFMPYLGKLWSDVDYATANVNGKKLARKSGTDELHLTYQRRGKVCYSTSADGGATWLNSVELADPGYAWDPCIAMDQSSQPCIAYPIAKTGYTAGLQFARYDGSAWQFTPVIGQTHMVGGFNLSPASMAIDPATNNVHLTVETSSGSSDGYLWQLWYYQFNANDPFNPIQKVMIDSMFVHNEPYLKSPSLAMDVLGNCHMTYTKNIYTVDNGEVYYAEQVGGVWQAPINLSNSETPSTEASIDVYGGKVYATWTELEDVGTQVYRNKKELGGAWNPINEPCSEIGTNGSIEAYTPSCASGIAMWAENIDNANYAVKYLRPDVGATVQTLSASTNLLSYPHGALALDGSTLRGAWTEVISGGDYGPWISEIKSTSGAGKKVAYLEVEAGTVTPSVYTDYRDGYITYPSGVSVDYAASELTYTLPYLIPGNDYTVQIVGYHESSETWNEQVKLDGKEAKVLKVKAHVPETLLVNIPAGYYASDKQITLSIKKLTGDYAAIASIAVYQTEKATVGKIGGAQMAERTEARGQEIAFKLQPSFPNPARNLANISFSLPQSGQASLKVYNIQGQLVKTLIDDVKQAGVHSVSWDCKNDGGKQVSNGIYLYRLITKENTETKKITILK